MEFDEKELRREIAFAIRNIHGKNDPNPLKFLPPFKSRCFSFLFFWLSLFREVAAAHELVGVRHLGVNLPTILQVRPVS